MIDSGIPVKGTVLLVAFQFPPFRGSSGLQRTLRFAQYLPRYGWNPVVLSAMPLAYEAVSAPTDLALPPSVVVHRAFALDTARHCSLFGRYPRSLALPDRWTSWQWGAVPAGLRLIRRHKVDAIWSTFPIATAHRIGLSLAQRSGLPWVAEFRDPMWEHDYPADPVVNRCWKRLESAVVAQAQRVVVTTPGAAETYRSRYPRRKGQDISIIENGFDEDAFKRAVDGKGREDVANSLPARERLTILHSGVVYRSERDPSQLFAALASLKSKGAISSATLQIVFRASGDDAAYGRDVERLGISDLVLFKAAIDYEAALREMLNVDGLLILQASNCNSQIPAKLYEYVRAGRPILALTDPKGDTARALISMGAGPTARLDSQAEIEQAILGFLQQVSNGTWPRLSDAVVSRYSREAQAGEFARLLDGLPRKS